MREASALQISYDARRVAVTRALSHAHACVAKACDIKEIKEVRHGISIKIIKGIAGREGARQV